MNKNNYWWAVLITCVAFVSVTLNETPIKIEVFEKSDYLFVKALMVSCDENVFCFAYSGENVLLDIMIWLWNSLIPLPSLVLLLIIQVTIYTYVWVRNICMALFVLVYLITLRPVLWLLGTAYIPW